MALLVAESVSGQRAVRSHRGRDRWAGLLPGHLVAYDAHVDHLLAHGGERPGDELLVHVGIQLWRSSTVVRQRQEDQTWTSLPTLDNDIGQ